MFQLPNTTTRRAIAFTHVMFKNGNPFTCISLSIDCLCMIAIRYYNSCSKYLRTAQYPSKAKGIMGKNVSFRKSVKTR